MTKNNSTARLFYDYPSTAKIRFHIRNVMTNDRGLYLIQTEKLRFTIAEKLCIKSGYHVYIPNAVYQQVLMNYYNKTLQ